MPLIVARLECPETQIDDRFKLSGWFGSVCKAELKYVGFVGSLSSAVLLAVFNKIEKKRKTVL